MHASKFLDYDKLPNLIAAGLITRRIHPEDPGLVIYNCTARTGCDSIWTPGDAFETGWEYGKDLQVKGEGAIMVDPYTHLAVKSI